jgi:hypothetical protein
VTAPFTWIDGERTIRFGRGVAAEAVDVLGGPGFTLLTTPRAAASAPGVADRAAAVVHVPSGLVEVVAAELRPHLGQRLRPSHGRSPERRAAARPAA